MSKQFITRKEFDRKVDSLWSWNVNYRHLTRKQIANRLYRWYRLSDSNG